MRRMLLRTVALTFVVVVPHAADVLARQFDPLKAIREKAQKLKKAIDCAVDDPACVEAPRPPNGPSS